MEQWAHVQQLHAELQKREVEINERHAALCTAQEAFQRRRDRWEQQHLCESPGPCKGPEALCRRKEDLEGPGPEIGLLLGLACADKVCKVEAQDSISTAPQNNASKSQVCSLLPGAGVGRRAKFSNHTI